MCFRRVSVVRRLSSMRCRDLLGRNLVELYQLLCRYLPVKCRIVELCELYRRKCIQCARRIFIVGMRHMRKRHLRRGRIKCLCNLSRWRVLGGPWCFKLRELCSGLLPGRHWGIELHGLYSWDVLTVAGRNASIELHRL